MTLRDVLVALSWGPRPGGPGSGTDPLLRLVAGLPCSPVEVPEGAVPAYVQRTIARRAAMQHLDELCFWHLLLVEIPPDSRAVTAARRALHIRLQNAQVDDDQAVLKTANGG